MLRERVVLSLLLFTVACLLAGADHATAWDQAVTASQAYADYAEVLNRPIPIFRLDAATP